jgi:hypothetical protein
MIVSKADILTNKNWNQLLKLKPHLFYDNRFLSYHDVFEKKIKWHHLIFMDDAKIKTIAILNGVELSENNKKVHISCEGVSFGGFHFARAQKISEYMELLESYIEYLKANNFKKCIMKLPPAIYYENPSEEYEYAHLHTGFKLAKYSITNIVDLEYFNFDKLPNPLKRSIHKSNVSGEIKIFENPDDEQIKKIYDILFLDRSNKNVNVTHTFEELKYLNNNISEKMVFFGAYFEKKLIGICLLFIVKPDIILNFYMAANPLYIKSRISDLILYRTIEWSKINKFRIYDIGTSNIDNNFLTGLFNFKKKFLADGYLRKTYLLEL